MRGKSLLAFAMAIGCGLVAMVGVQQVLSKQNVDPDADKVAVFVAATEILPGQTLDMNMLERRKFLKGSVPKEAVIDPKQLEKRALTCKVMPGDIIRSDKLGAEGKTGASISIPTGLRVISVATNTTQAHSGMIQPGDRVDVMVTYKVQPPSGGGREYPETKTILGYIQVFATDAVRDVAAAGDASKAVAAMKNVSLLVTPDQAQILMMAQSVGELCLSLRNAGDVKDVETSNLTPDEFRKSVVMNGRNLESPDPSKQEKPRENQKGERTSDLNNFLDDAAGQRGRSGQSKAESDTESWDIAFYGKEGLRIETVEVARRPVEATAAAGGSTPSTATSVMGTLLNILQVPANRQPKAGPGKSQEEGKPAPVRDNTLAKVQPTSATRQPATTTKTKPATTKLGPTKSPQK